MKNTKRIHTIDTFYTDELDTVLKGLDEQGKEFTIVIPTLELLQWLDWKHMKKEAKKYIDSL